MCPAAGRQTNVVVASDDAGGTYLVWLDDRRGSIGVFAQHLTPTGTIAAGWPALGLPVRDVIGSSASDPEIVPDGSGGAIIAWRDLRQPPGSIYAQQVSAAGNIQWAANGIPATGSAAGGSCFGLATDDAGGAFLCWSDLRAPHSHVYVQHLTTAGQTSWPAGGVSTNIVSSADQQCPRCIPDGAGGMIVAWSDWRFDYYDVAREGTVQRATTLMQRVDSLGTSQWADSGAVIAPGATMGLASDHAGGAIVGIDGFYNGGTFFRTQVFRIRPTGQPRWSMVISADLVSTRVAALLGDDAGGAIVTMAHNRSVGDSSIYAEHYAADGAPLWGWTRVCFGAQVQNGRTPMISDGAGGALLVWQDGRADAGNHPPESSWDIYAQHVTSVGQIADGWPLSGRPICTADSLQEQPGLTMDGAGGAIVAWNDDRAGSPNVYVTRLTNDAVSATLVSLVSAAAASDHATLIWSISNGADGAVVVYRFETGSWQPIATFAPDGNGRITFIDRNVVPGARYEYRLGIREHGVEAFFGETWLTIPIAAELALRGLQPNPAEAGLTLAFSLPDNRPARLELLDVSGRVIRAREVGSLGAGNHIVTLNGGARVPAGIYWVRLTHGGSALVARGAVVR